MNNPIDVGDGYTFTPRYYEGELHGFDHAHPRSDGTVCAPHWIPVGLRGWELHSLDPLTLSPSLLCRACGSHGFVREGKWVPA